jgi:NAD-dependent dihydropyrimidine dehydrogenase PreA subunit/flavodoxin
MIFYFSATGNTRWAAIQLAKATGERLVFIADAVAEEEYTYTITEGERIGFVFPVHGWRPPKLVRGFVEKLHITSTTSPYCYALCTAGDDIGLTIDYLNNSIHLNKKLAAAGINEVVSAFSLIMPESYVGLPFMDVDTKDNEQQKKTEAANKLQHICKDVVEYRKGVFLLDNSRWPRINSNIIGAFFEKYLITDKPFHVVEDRCVKCGICANVCPVNDIIGGHGKKPEWKHNGSCLTCFNCYHHCPHHAIEYGSRTKHKGQYFYR